MDEKELIDTTQKLNNMSINVLSEEQKHKISEENRLKAVARKRQREED